MPEIMRWPFLEALSGHPGCDACTVIKVPAGVLGARWALGAPLAMNLAICFNQWRRCEFMKTYPDDLYQLDSNVLRDCRLPIAQYDLAPPLWSPPPESYFHEAFEHALHGIAERQDRRRHGPHCLCFEDGAGVRGYVKVHAAQHNVSSARRARP